MCIQSWLNGVKASSGRDVAFKKSVQMIFDALFTGRSIGISIVVFQTCALFNGRLNVSREQSK